MNTSGDFHLLIMSYFFVIYILSWLILLYNYRSVDCFRLGWPMRADADFFCLSIGQIRQNNGVSNDGYFLFRFFSKVWLLLASKSPTIPRK